MPILPLPGSGYKPRWGPNQYPTMHPDNPAQDWNRQPYDTLWGTGRKPNQPIDPLIRPYLDSFFGSGSGGGGTVGTPPARVAPPDPANRQAAEAAAFGRAKDRVGQATQGLMRAIRGNMSRRGIGGSSIEGREMGRALTSGAGELGDVIRDQAITGLQRDYAVEDRNYAGEIQQRGQDIPLLQQRQDQALNVLRMLMRY